MFSLIYFQMVRTTLKPQYNFLTFSQFFWGMINLKSCIMVLSIRILHVVLCCRTLDLVGIPKTCRTCNGSLAS